MDRNAFSTRFYPEDDTKRLLLLSYILPGNDPSSSTQKLQTATITGENPIGNTKQIIPGLIDPNFLVPAINSGSIMYRGLPEAQCSTASGGTISMNQASGFPGALAVGMSIHTLVPIGVPLTVEQLPSVLLPISYQDEIEIDDLQFIELPTIRSNIPIMKGRKLSAISGWDEEIEYGD